MGAVQAQDYPAAKWAVGLRTQGLTDTTIEQAVERGELIRTHVLRPTWHFVTPADIRWMLALTAPRVNLAMGTNFRRLGLDETLFARTDKILARALEGGKQLTRDELADALRENGVDGDLPLRVAHILARAELDRVICSGARRGKQPTYALFDERVPPTPLRSRDEAIAELTRRYFLSHGPATLKDFNWWSGLTGADIKAGIAMVKNQLAEAEIDGKTYWFDPQMPFPAPPVEEAFLLPNFDEYMVGYSDRSAIVDSRFAAHPRLRDSAVLTHVVVLGGQIAGTWKRTIRKESVDLGVQLFRPLTASEAAAFEAAIRRYSNFLGLPVRLVEGL